MTHMNPSTRMTAMSLALIGSVTLAGCGDDMEAREASDYEALSDTAAEISDRTEMTPADTGMALNVEEDFDELDLNGDAQLDMDEVTEWATRNGFTYDVWSEGDATADGFYGTLFTRFDADENGTIGQSEFERNAPMFAVLSETDFSAWDTDGNAELNRSEVVAGLHSTELYASIDADGSATIEDEELLEWFFDVVDVNDDEMIDATEWTNAETFHENLER